MKNGKVMTMRSARAKVAMAYFGPKGGNFGHIFWDVSFKLVLSIIWMNIDGKTIYKWIGYNIFAQFFLAQNFLKA